MKTERKESMSKMQAYMLMISIYKTIVQGRAVPSRVEDQRYL